MAKKKLPTYQITEDSVITAISMVESPAVESDFIFLSMQKPVFLEDSEKHLVYGCALRPDFPIYRRYEGEDGKDEEFYIEFSAKVIERLSQEFMQNGFQNQWTLEHSKYAQGLSVVESWIKVDEKNDKSIALGLDETLPVGTWFLGCKVLNTDIWDDIKNSRFKGFSIESICSLDLCSITIYLLFKDLF